MNILRLVADWSYRHIRWLATAMCVAALVHVVDNWPTEPLVVFSGLLFALGAWPFDKAQEAMRYKSKGRAVVAAGGAVIVATLLTVLRFVE